jgi:RNA polymerase sigma factor for flagellar operon FliA
MPLTTPTPADAIRCKLGTGTSPGFKREPKFDAATIWKRYARSGPGSAVEEEVVQQYLPLVRAVVGRVAMSLPSHVSGEDLYSAGLVGLLNAVRRFNPKSGASFETYSRVRIRGAVFDELRRLDWVPRSIHDKARKVEKVMRELEQRKGKSPSDAEMAKALKISVDEFQELAEEIKPATFVCLDSVRYADADDGDSQYESVADDTQVHPAEATMANEMAHLVTQRLDKLPEAQRKVLALYYFEDLRLREIAERFGVTESRICQIHSQAILALRSYVQKQES